MKSNDRAILCGVAVLAVIAAFWFLVLGPKRDESAALETQLTDLQAQVGQQEATAASGELAKTDFSQNYRQLITLGKAIPIDAETPSLLTQLQTLSADSKVRFQSITLGGSAGGSAAPAPTTAAPTEASAALLPIGASVGTAGLPIMPYSLQFEGGFFEIADFFGAIDGMVDASGETVSVNGRLLTIDGFSLAAGEGEDDLTASVNVTSYLSPADQGATGGATATGPPATGIPTADPAATTSVAPAVVSP